MGGVGVGPNACTRIYLGRRVSALCEVSARHVAGNSAVCCAQNGIVVKGIVPGSDGCLHQKFDVLVAGASLVRLFLLPTRSVGEHFS